MTQHHDARELLTQLATALPSLQGGRPGPRDGAPRHAPAVEAAATAAFLRRFAASRIDRREDLFRFV